MIIYFTTRQAMRNSKVKGTRIDNGIDSPKGKRWCIQLDTTVAKRTLQIAAKWKAKKSREVSQQKPQEGDLYKVIKGYQFSVGSVVKLKGYYDHDSSTFDLVRGQALWLKSCNIWDSLDNMVKL